MLRIDRVGHDYHPHRNTHNKPIRWLEWRLHRYEHLHRFDDTSPQRHGKLHTNLEPDHKQDWQWNRLNRIGTWQH
jgi:hypothetical protein